MNLRNISRMYYHVHYHVSVTLRYFILCFVPSIIFSFVRLFARSYVRTYVRSYVHTYARSFIRSSIRSFVFVHSFVRLSLSSSVCSCVRLLVRSFSSSSLLCFRSFVCSLVRPVIRVHISIILQHPLYAHYDVLCPSAHKGRGKGHKDRPRVHGLTTAQCEGFGGSCSASTDCDLSSNVFHGRCDNSTSGCCISKDGVCASRNGTCVSSADCEADSDSHASRLGCSSDDVVCCVADRRPRGRHGGRRQGQWNTCNYNALS